MYATRQLKSPTKLSRNLKLRFSPYAWAKLLTLRDLGPTEIGGFGIASADDLLFIEDVVLVTQACSSVTVEFDDAAVADYFDAQVDRGLRPEQFGRIWLHTHPGSSPTPSGTDEETFARVFGGCQWAVMFILACGGETYCRMKVNVGPGCEVPLAVDVDFGRPFSASDECGWEKEYESCVREAIPGRRSYGFFPELPGEFLAEMPGFYDRDSDFESFAPFLAEDPEIASFHEGPSSGEFLT